MPGSISGSEAGGRASAGLLSKRSRLLSSYKETAGDVCRWNGARRQGTGVSGPSCAFAQ
jgi:hypothetical protein